MGDGSPLFADAAPCFYDISFAEAAAPTNPSLPPFPNPIEFDTYDDFWRAAIAWKRSSKAALRGAVPPVPVSIAVFRPRPSGPPKFAPPRRAGAVPYGPAVYLSVMDRVLSPGAELDFSEVVHCNRRDYVLSEYLRPEPRWQGRLVPKEPAPAAYATYEAFAAALRSWKAVAARAATVEHPAAFEKSFDLMVRPRAVAPPARAARAERRAATTAAVRLPAAESFRRLFRQTEQLGGLPSRRYPANLPFPTSSSPQMLFNLHMDFQPLPTRELVQGMVRARAYGAPWFLEPRPMVPGPYPVLGCDSSPDEFSVEFSKLNKKGLALLRTQFAFWLAQLHLVPDARFWCRMYVALTKLVADEADATINLCFLGTQTVVNTIQLFKVYSHHPIVAHSFS
jgi:hypothetical protein